MPIPNAPRLDQSTAVVTHLRRLPCRDTPSLLVLLGDAHAEPLVAWIIDDLPAESPPQHEKIRMLVPMLRHVAQDLDDVATFLLVVCRAGAPYPEGEDFAWHDVALAAAAGGGPTCLGVYVQTPRGVAPVLPAAA